MKKTPASKRIPVFLLTLVFILSGLLLCGCKVTETVTIDEPEQGSFPPLGEIIHGFAALEIRDYDQLGAKVCLFEHEKSGARIIYIANDDPKKACALSFNTAPADDSGACNILRHALLSGSERFPEGPSIVELTASNPDINSNSFVLPNAACYTFSCFSEELLLEYALRGIDACFKPLVFEQPSVFEAARLAALKDIAEAEDFRKTAYREGLKIAFDGASFSYDSMGTREGVEAAALDALEAFYQKYYRASNCLGMLYGNFDDYTKFLALADEYFINLEDSGDPEPSEYKPISHTLMPQIECPAPGWEILPPVDPNLPEANSCIFYAVMLGEMPETDMAVWDVLDFVVSDESAPIMKRLLELFPQEKFPKTKFRCKVELSGPEPALIVFAERLPEDAARIFKEAVDAGFASIEAGEIRGYIGYNIQLQALNAGSFVNKWGNVDSDQLFLNVAKKYAESGKALYFIDYAKSLDLIGDWNTKGTFAKIFKDYLSDNWRRVLLTVNPLIEEPAQEEIPSSP